MPTYEYVCRACGHEFERFQSITAPAIKTCPTCGKPKVERKIGIGAGVLFKGGGFYETDYRSEQYTKAAKAESDAAKPAEAPKPAESAAGDRATSAAAAPSPSLPSSKGADTKSSEGSSGTSPSKATHPSRIGRGVGNIVQRPSAPPAGGDARRKNATKAPRKKGSR